MHPPPSSDPCVCSDAYGPEFLIPPLPHLLAAATSLNIMELQPAQQ